MPHDSGQIAALVVERLLAHPDTSGVLTLANTYVAMPESEPVGEGAIVARVSPETTSRPHAASGVALEEGVIRVAVYRRLTQDRAGQDAQRLNNPTLGLMDVLVRVERCLTNSWLDGSLIEPLLPTSLVNLPDSLSMPDYAGRALDFSYSIVPDWAATQTMVDGTTPDVGQEGS